LEPKFWEEVGDEKPTSNLYKPGLFEAMEESRTKKSRVMLKGSQAKAIFMQGSY
jgi:predicted RNA-binding protein